MIPLSDDNPSKRIPFINTFLILINLSVFICQNFVIPEKGQSLFYTLGFIPYEFSHFVDLDPIALVPVPFTLVTSMFIHGGWLHILGNMLYLWIFGDNVEDRLGHFKYLVFYGICGMVGSLTHALVSPNSQIPTVGASGAIAGVLGAYMFLFPKAGIRTLLILGIFIRVVRIPAIVMIGYWILIQVLSGLAEYGSGAEAGIAWFAHIGGFFSGLLLVLIVKKQRR